MTSRPKDWPEQYAQFGTSSCNHYMHWDDADDCYRCIQDCGYTEPQPPQRLR